MTELKPCPICNGPAKTILSEGYWRTGCLNCKVFALNEKEDESMTLWNKVCSTDADTMRERINKRSDTLKPCPFCGEMNIHTYNPTAYEPGNDASIFCENPICGAEVRGRTMKEAIAKWNRRVTE